VPRSEILRISELLATKLIENELVAYVQLEKLMASEDALSKRGFTIASYALCGFANLGSLGIQIGVLSALAPSRNRLIARIGLSAMISGFISTLQAAAIACVFLFSAPPVNLRGLNWSLIHLFVSLSLAVFSGMLV
jgi:CNT family concentrative nucleoside transporter